MTLTEFLKRVNYALRGTDDDVPTVGDDDANYWVTTFNRKKDEMYDDVTKNWESAYDEKTIGTISASTSLVFNLDDSDTNNKLSGYLAPAEQAFVIDANGTYHYFDIVKSTEIDRRYQQVIITGQNPKKLRFTRPILAGDAMIGRSLILPAYWRPADLDPAGDGTQVIPVDDPNWGAMATAAQVAFNDITYEDKFDDLDGQANVLWKNMVKKNRKRNSGNPKTTQYRVKRITSPR
jgi:hypothetical protein